MHKSFVTFNITNIRHLSVEQFIAFCCFVIMAIKVAGPKETASHLLIFVHLLWQLQKCEWQIAHCTHVAFRVGKCTLKCMPFKMWHIYMLDCWLVLLWLYLPLHGERRIGTYEQGSDNGLKNERRLSKMRPFSKL